VIGANPGHPAGDKGGTSTLILDKKHGGPRAIIVAAQGGNPHPAKISRMGHPLEEFAV